MIVDASRGLWGEADSVTTDGCSCCAATLHKEIDRDTIIKNMQNMKSVLDELLDEYSITYEELQYE